VDSDASRRGPLAGVGERVEPQPIAGCRGVERPGPLESVRRCSTGPRGAGSTWRGHTDVPRQRGSPDRYHTAGARRMRVRLSPVAYRAHLGVPSTPVRSGQTQPHSSTVLRASRPVVFARGCSVYFVKLEDSTRPEAGSNRTRTPFQELAAIEPPAHSTDTHLSWGVGGCARQRMPSSAGIRTARP
jgi:hypothetical protein